MSFFVRNVAKNGIELINEETHFLPILTSHRKVCTSKKIHQQMMGRKIMAYDPFHFISILQSIFSRFIANI
jgi:hypothetical protein